MTKKIENDEFIKTNEDNYVDISKKIGTSNSQRLKMNFLDDQSCAAVYTFDPIAKKYINIICDDMTRSWLKVQQDTDGIIEDYFQKINLKINIKRALQASKIFGGSLIFMVIDDGQEPNMPVSLDKIKSIKKLKVFDRSKINILDVNYYSDVTKENFGEPEYFELSINNSHPITVHETRCLVFKGEYFPSDQLSPQLSSQLSNSNFWGVSTLNSVFEIFKRYNISILSLFETISKFNIDVVKIKNLMSLLKTKDGEKQLKNRVNYMDYVKSITNTLVLDSDEEFQTISQQLNSVSDVFTKLEQVNSLITGIPSNIFFGTSAKGLNATGDNEIRIYYDKIKSNQEEELLDPMNRIVKYILASKDFVQKNKIDNPKIIFNPLWQMTEKEIVEMRNKQADTDSKYVEIGVLDSEEIRNSRFGGDNYSIETVLESEEPEEPEKPEEPEEPEESETKDD